MTLGYFIVSIEADIEAAESESKGTIELVDDTNINLGPTQVSLGKEKKFHSVDALSLFVIFFSLFLRILQSKHFSQPAHCEIKFSRVHQFHS